MMNNLEIYEGVLQRFLKMPYLEVRSAHINTLSVYLALDRLKHDPVRIEVALNPRSPFV